MYWHVFAQPLQLFRLCVLVGGGGGGEKEKLTYKKILKTCSHLVEIPLAI